LGVGLTTPHHKKTAVTEPQERRPRPDMGCRAIGWMDIVLSQQAYFPGWNYENQEISNGTTELQILMN
jgi:hypothetical protein